MTGIKHNGQGLYRLQADRKNQARSNPDPMQLVVRNNHQKNFTTV